MLRTALVSLVVVLGLTGCQGRETVPETGRRRPKLQYSEAEMAELGVAAYAEVTKKYKEIRGTPEAAMVQRVGRKIADACGKNYTWEFKLLDSPDLNAFCLPGGKIAVFSGILPVTKNEAGLGVVLGHEVAHATLQHGNERMSQPMVKRILSFPVTITANVWGTISPGSRRVVMGAFGIGHVVGHFMPYDQNQETEADVVGLRYLKDASYDIHEAPRFWQRMIDAMPNRRKGDALSTHPDPEKRIKRLDEEIKEMEAETSSGGK